MSSSQGDLKLLGERVNSEPPAFPGGGALGNLDRLVCLKLVGSGFVCGRRGLMDWAEAFLLFLPGSSLKTTCHWLGPPEALV